LASASDDVSVGAGPVRPALPPEAPGIVEPATTDEAARVFAEAAAEGWTVSIDRSGGGVVLSTVRLNRILETEAGDLTASVEAGIRLSVLNRRLAEQGQMLALDPPGDPTIGACLAGSLSGPRRHRYGAPRDLLLGVTVVLADGTVANAGGKVVKNVAGYDLGKLFCGSEGRFGLIARASLRLHPLPDGERTLVVPVAGATEAFTVAQQLHHSTLVPSAVDLLWRRAGGSRLAVLFEGSERAVAAQLETARELLGGEEGRGCEWDEARAWQARAQGRISFPPGGLVQTLHTLDEALARPGLGIAYTSEPLREEGDAGARLLAERVRAALDPGGVLV
jgi:glycolate oxidase FAD binding subunit